VVAKNTTIKIQICSRT